MAADPQSQASRPFASEEKEQPQTDPTTRLPFPLKINPRIGEGTFRGLTGRYPKWHSRTKVIPRARDDLVLKRPY